MNIWRMAFRAGDGGPEMWPDCFRLGVAAITYRPIATTDLSLYAAGEPKELWSQLSPAQKYSLRQVVDSIENKPSNCGGAGPAGSRANCGGHKRSS